MLPEAWTPLRHHPTQNLYWRHPARFKVVCAGRGSGKTELAKRKVIRWLSVKKPWRDVMYFYALPTFNQARRVAWQSLKELCPPEWIPKGGISESSMILRTVFGSELHLVGMDKPHRIEGNQWDGGVIDECADQKPGAFNISVLPALSHKLGWCDRIGVPKRFGSGAEDFRSEFEKGLTGKVKGLLSLTWPSSDILTEEQLEWALGNLNSKDFNEQYNATWQTVGGGVFHAFDEIESVRECQYNPTLPIIVGSDFNVSPMSWVLCHVYPDRLEVFDELSINDTNTVETLSILYQKYAGHRSGWKFYGDASSRARKTSASMSDYFIIANDGRFSPKTIDYPKANPLIADRFAATNAMLLNAKHERRCFIDPSCKQLLRDLKLRTLTTTDKTIGHMTDALGYIIHKRWPLGKRQTPGAVGGIISV